MADKIVQDSIYKYLLEQNRPYSLVDIHTNLHKEHGKTAMQRALDSLVQDGKVIEKTYGKQKVYLICQDVFPSVSDEDISAMDRNLAELKAKVAALDTELKTVDTELKSFQTSLTVDQIKDALKQCDSDLSSKLDRLETLKKNAGTVNADELRVSRQNCAKFVTEWRKRKRLATEMLDAILEGYPKSKRELMDETGFETDQEAGVSLPV